MATTGIVDCEYNRVGLDVEPKRVVYPVIERSSAEDTEGRTVFPDVIVHHRTLAASDDNLLVIEAKKNTTTAATADKNLDLKKLKAYTVAPFEYTLGLYLVFNVTVRTGPLIAEACCIVDGDIASEKTERLIAKLRSTTNVGYGQ